MVEVDVWQGQLVFSEEWYCVVSEAQGLEMAQLRQLLFYRTVTCPAVLTVT